MKCPACSYVRQSTDLNPEWQCPACHIAYAKAAPPAPKPQPQAVAEPEFIIYPDVDKNIYRLARSIAVITLLFVLWAFYATFYVPWSDMHHHAARVTFPGVKLTFVVMIGLIFTVWALFDTDFLFEFAPDSFKEKHGVGNVQRWKVIVLLVLIIALGSGAQIVLHDTARQMHYQTGSDD